MSNGSRDSARDGAGQQTVLFEIVNGNALQACSLNQLSDPILDQGDFAVLARLQIPGDLTAACRRVLTTVIG
jgi:hypothetical protein